ncbi:hypothetical protein AABB24_010488 [Solanum stoloniferum]|uniref:Uncharacterized protein n=1 Tax=Solanum stoloniferum TaxID=62892 RepID=A0ABD2UA27_9SOLN
MNDISLSVQPYTSLRVLCQFKQNQVIPLRSNMDQFKYDFGLDNLQVHNILRRWERVVTIRMGAQQAFCTLEYCICILKEAKGIELSGDGYYGLMDERENIWARNLLNLGYEVTPYVKEQMAPSSWDQYLQDVEFVG